MEDLENNKESHEEMQANVHKISDLVYDYSINEMGKEKACNIAQCIETELEYSDQNKLGQQKGKRLKFDEKTKLK